VEIDQAPFKVREPLPWKRALLFVAFFVVPLAVHEWPWEFLPLRWQYPFTISRGERMVAAIDRFRATNGRFPSMQELGGSLPLEDWPCSECYEPRGASYSLTVTAGFDYSISYDPHTREFRRYP
jgi:hypothetical protein